MSVLNYFFYLTDLLKHQASNNIHHALYTIKYYIGQLNDVCGKIVYLIKYQKQTGESILSLFSNVFSSDPYTIVIRYRQCY